MFNIASISTETTISWTFIKMKLFTFLLPLDVLHILLLIEVHIDILLKKTTIFFLNIKYAKLIRSVAGISLKPLQSV